MLGGCGRDHLASFEAEKNQQIHVAQAACRHCLHREKVGRPKRLGVPSDEVVPTIGSLIRSRLDALFFEDVADGLSTDAFETQFSQLTDDAGVAK